MFIRQLGLTARLAIYVTLSLSLMAADVHFKALESVRALGAAVFHPVQSTLAAPFRYLVNASAFFTVHGELLQKSRQLQTDNRAQAVRLQAMQTLAAENAEMRRMLGLSPPPGFVARYVEVIGRVPDPFSRRLNIAGGSGIGIKPGLPVVDAEGLVGQVTRVHPTSSEVTLLTSHEQSVPVMVLRNGLRMIVTGLGSDALMEISFLDAHADVREGDELVTSGLDGIYPAGIPVARVLRVEPPRNTPFAHALCQPMGGVEQGHLMTLLERRP